MASPHLEARAIARSAARPGDWLSLVLDHHQYIADQFVEARSATTAEVRKAAQQHLAAVLTAHAAAEESIIYPAMCRMGKQEDADRAYAEQAAARQKLAALALIDPASTEYLQQLEQIRADVARHVFAEESEWFMALKQGAPEAEQALLTQRYPEEFDRCLGRGESVSAAYQRIAIGCFRRSDWLG